MVECVPAFPLIFSVQGISGGLRPSCSGRLRGRRSRPRPCSRTSCGAPSATCPGTPHPQPSRPPPHTSPSPRSHMNPLPQGKHHPTHAPRACMLTPPSPPTHSPCTSTPTHTPTFQPPPPPPPSHTHCPSTVASRTNPHSGLEPGALVLGVVGGLSAKLAADPETSH